jgi:outer membrane protein assembly factor BamA
MMFSIFYFLSIALMFVAPEQPPNGKTGMDLSGCKLIALDVAGTTAFPREVLISDFPIRIGDKADWTRINAGLKRIRRRFEDAGYIDFKYTPLIEIDRNAGTAACSFDIVQGKQYTVRMINFIGDTSLHDGDMRLALSRLGLEEGKIFRPGKLDEAIKALNKLLGAEQLTSKNCDTKKPFDAPGSVDIYFRWQPAVR